MSKSLLTTIAVAISIIASPLQHLLAWDLPDYTLTESDLTEILQKARKLGVDTSQPLLSYEANWRPNQTIEAEFRIQAGEPGERFVEFQTLSCVWEINYNLNCEFERRRCP